MIELLAGFAFIILSSLIFHRVTPAGLARSRCAALRSWALAMTVSLNGVILVMQGLGYPVPPSLQGMAHLSLGLCAVLAVRRLRGSPICTWAEAGRIQQIRSRSS